MNDPCREFDCCECGRHIIVICSPVDAPNLCGLCTHSPGWLDNPEVRALLDPEGSANPPDLDQVAPWTGGTP